MGEKGVDGGRINDQWVYLRGDLMVDLMVDLGENMGHAILLINGMHRCPYSGVDKTRDYFGGMGVVLDLGVNGMVHEYLGGN